MTMDYCGDWPLGMNGCPVRSEQDLMSVSELRGVNNGEETVSIGLGEPRVSVRWIAGRGSNHRIRAAEGGARAQRLKVRWGQPHNKAVNPTRCLQDGRSISAPGCRIARTCQPVRDHGDDGDGSTPDQPHAAGMCSSLDNISAWFRHAMLSAQKFAVGAAIGRCPRLWPRCRRRRLSSRSAWPPISLANAGGRGANSP